MLTFDIDSRDSVGNGVGCETCCCAVATMMPGETNKFVLNYAYWSLPIGGRGITDNHTFSVEQKKSISPSQGGLPVIAIANPTTTLNTALVGDLTDYVTDPDANTLTFTPMPLFGPGFGTLALASNGAFTYTPNNGFTGYDRFFFSVSDGVNKSIVGEVVVGVAVSAAVASQFTPKVRVRTDRTNVDVHMQTLGFPVEVSPAALVGEAFRITVRQETNDCDFQSYWNMSCYDVLISKCG
jgi:VCBS repeat-containing protein